MDSSESHNRLNGLSTDDYRAEFAIFGLQGLESTDFLFQLGNPRCQTLVFLAG